MYIIEKDRDKRATLVSFKLEKPEQVNDFLYSDVLNGIAKNCKVGPFKATSGVILPYYLNAPTNFLDKHLAPKILDIFAKYIQHSLKSILPSDLPSKGSVFVCGMEVAGGILSSQLAGANYKALNEWLDFFYIRKEKKSTGTRQQLEGPQVITSRNTNSPTAYAIWVDDALSTGSSLCDGAKLLKEFYNIEVVAALYLVDRSVDRKNLKKEFQYLADPIFDNMILSSIFDLEEVDERFKAINPEKYEEYENSL